MQKSLADPDRKRLLHHRCGNRAKQKTVSNPSKQAPQVHSGSINLSPRANCRRKRCHKNRLRHKGNENSAHRRVRRSRLLVRFWMPDSGTTLHPSDHSDFSTPPASEAKPGNAPKPNESLPLQSRRNFSDSERDTDEVIRTRRRPHWDVEGEDRKYAPAQQRKMETWRVELQTFCLQSRRSTN